jgi:hypothetical protein
MSEAETEPVDVCDGCHEPLAYLGNGLAGKSYCDTCYDRRVSVL